MGKLKQSLPEDIDITDERDDFTPPEKEVPTDVDISINCLKSAVNGVREQGALELLPYISDLLGVHSDINSLIDELVEYSRRPF